MNVCKETCEGGGVMSVSVVCVMSEDGVMGVRVVIGV